MALFTGDDSAVYADVSAVLDEGVVAVVAAGLLFVLPVSWPERRFTLTWNEAARIDWGTILLFGSGIALGGLMSKTGLAKEMGEGLADALNVSSEISITILVVVIAVIISEATSNTASAAIVVPIAVAARRGVGHQPDRARPRRRLRRQLRIHAAGVDPAQRHRLQLRLPADPRMIKAGAVFDVIGAVLCVVGVAIMARVVGLTG